MFGRRANFILVELAWQWCHVLVLGGISASGFGGDKIFGRSTDLMLAELAWQWSHVSVSMAVSVLTDFP